MIDHEGPLYQLDVRIGATRTACFFNSNAEFDKARGFANYLGLGLLTKDDLSTMPQDHFFADAEQFRKGVIAEILADRALRVTNSDVLDSMFNQRIFEVRDALRAEGWHGAGYDILTKDGANAVFKFDHAPNGRNVIGMSVNGIEDTFELSAKDLAVEVTKGAPDHLIRNRRVDVALVAADGSEGAYSVAFGDDDRLVETPIKWKPAQPEGATHEVRVRLRSYGRFAGDAYVLTGDIWRDLESEGETDKLWKNLLAGVPGEQAVQAALGIVKEQEPTADAELQAAQRTAARYGLTDTRVADPTEKRASIGPVMAITTSYIVQNVGMNSSVLHHVANFERLPVMGGRYDIRYEAGKGVIHEGRTRERLFGR